MTTFHVGNLWMRARGIPPLLATWWRDKYGRLHSMRVELVADFKEFLMKAWSVKLIVGQFVLDLAYDLTPAMQDIIPLKVYLPVRGVIVALTLVSQITKQKGLREDP